MQRFFSMTLIGLLTLGLLQTALACPFCEAPSLTLTEQLNQSDVAVLVQWVSARPANREEGIPGATTYEVVQIVHDSSGALEREAKVTLDRDRAAQKGDLFVLLGTQGTRIEWSSPLEVSETSFEYMRQAPTQETAAQDRLEYFLQFLEYPDPLIANDAYAEFANAPYKDFVPLADRMPREQLRQWLTDPSIPATRMGLYGLMLGLAGDETDAELMRAKIVEQTEDFRLGVDGIMAGYLLLTKESGLEVIDEFKLRNSDVPFSETYAAMQALNFMWEFAPDRIKKKRLKESMRILLDRPTIADIVIAHLARWKDWEVQDRLLKLYDHK